MPTIDLMSQENKKVGTINLRDDVFAVKVNVPLVHQVLKSQLAGKRQGSAKTKTKAEVRGGGRKPYRQKGTGNARQGSIRSSQFVGGGQNFGPTPRSYEQATPKEMVRGALRSMLSDRLSSKRLLVVDEFSLKEPKTKLFSDILTKNFELKNVLVIDQKNDNLELSARNVAGVKILRTDGLNVYDLLKHEWVILTKGAVENVEGRLAQKS